jgi:hypothetical protein
MLTRIVPLPEHLTASRLDDLVDRLEERGVEVTLTEETLLITGPSYADTCALEVLLWEVEHECDGPHDADDPDCRSVLAEVAAALPFVPDAVRAALVHEMRLWRAQGEERLASGDVP